MKEKIEFFITDSIEKLETAKSKFSNTEPKPIHINQKYFNDKFIKDEDISESSELREFRELKEIKNPVLYWFELTSSDNNEAIMNKLKEYRAPLKKDFGNEKYRYTSAYKKNYDKNSTTLYVGKVETGFWGRMVTHLGYNKNKYTAGMQLFHWYKPELYGDIKLNYIVFEPNMRHLILILEKLLAKELKPLIGKY
jgi:hypothetical protein